MNIPIIIIISLKTVEIVFLVLFFIYTNSKKDYSQIGSNEYLKSYIRNVE